MKTHLPIDVKINVWDFIDVDKLNDYLDDFTGEVISGLTYTFEEGIKPNGDCIVSVDGDREED